MGKVTENRRVPLQPSHRVRGTHRANVRQNIIDEARFIMGVSAGLINLHVSTSFSYHYSPMIPLMLLTLECRMLGLVGEMAALQAQEDVE